MIVKIIGTQSPDVLEGHRGIGIEVQTGDATIVLDAGSGTHISVIGSKENNRGMLKAPQKMENLHVFLTHLDEDHYVDIFSYQLAAYTRYSLGLLKNATNIYLPQTPTDVYQFITSRKYQHTKYDILTPTRKYQIGHSEITLCPTVHSVETYAIKVKEAENILVYTSDTSFNAAPSLIQFAKNATMLISEGSLIESYNPILRNTHLLAEQAGIIAAKSDAKKLLITHLWPDEDPQNYLREAKRAFNNVSIAQEDQRFELRNGKPIRIQSPDGDVSLEE